MIINKFAEISGLKLNKKKTKAIWIGSQKKNKNRPLAIDITNEPTKTLGIYTSGQGLRYTLIFEGNSGQIRDPDLIYPGQIFLVPELN